MKLGDWLGFLCLALSLFILWQIRQILLLVFMAVVIATALNSVVKKIQTYGIQRSLAIPLTLGGLGVLSTLFFIIIVPPFVDQFERLLELLPRGFQRIPLLLDWVRRSLPDWAPDLPSASSLVSQLTAPLQALVRNSVAFFSDSVSVVLGILLILVLAAMMLVNPIAYRTTFIRLFPSFYRRRVDVILQDCEVSLGNWLAGILVNSVFIFSFSALGLWLLGIPLVLAHALLAGLLNFIPNIGPTLSVIFPVTIALLEEPWKAIAVLVLYIIIQQVESYWLTPTVMAKQVSLLPAMTLTAQIFFTTTFGIMGLILALPLAVVAKVWLQEVLVHDILDQWTVNPHQGTLNPATAAALPSGQAEPDGDPA